MTTMTITSHAPAECLRRRGDLWPVVHTELLVRAVRLTWDDDEVPVRIAGLLGGLLRVLVDSEASVCPSTRQSSAAMQSDLLCTRKRVSVVQVHCCETLGVSSQDSRWTASLRHSEGSAWSLTCPVLPISGKSQSCSSEKGSLLLKHPELSCQRHPEDP